MLRLALLFIAALRVSAAGSASIRVAIASDSTAATWHAPHLERGWGQFLGERFDAAVEIDNFAKPGASTKTFQQEGLWAKVLADRPTYILIQFGHNDSHTPDHPEHTDPAGEYRDLLRRFVADARRIGAIPILITPVQRRTPTDTLVPYVGAMKGVAAETHTALIDLHELSGKLYAQLGKMAQARVGAQRSDPTHFNSEGATMIANLVADALGQTDALLKTHLVHNAR